MNKLKLRDYQRNCIAEHFKYFERNNGNPLFSVPTGGGKSLIIAEYLRLIFTNWPDQKVIIATHSKELISQNYNEFIRHWGEILAPTGIYSAGLNRRETDASIIFAGIQSIYARAEEFGKVDLILVDECHLIPKLGAGRYRQFIGECKAINSKVKVIGYTATPFRIGGGYLHKGEGRIFTDIAYEVSIETLIKGGYLVPLIAKSTKNAIDTSKVQSANGDFKAGQLQDAAMREGCVEAAVNELVERAGIEGRKYWLVFSCGVKHAEEVMKELAKHDVNSRLILGTTPKEERAKIVREAMDGKITAIVNVGVLTTGFNWPRCDLLAMMRATKSTSLYVQIFGRGMRTFPEKKNCLVLDYGGNVMRHGPINRIRVKDKKATVDSDSEEELFIDDEDDLKARICSNCEAIIAYDELKCPVCGYEEPIEIEKHDRQASDKDPIDFTTNEFKIEAPVVHPVNYLFVERHKKEGKKDSLKVIYSCGLRSFAEWVCLEHTGFAKTKAVRWWLEMADFPAPLTIEEALLRKDEIRWPKMISVQRDGKYDRIVKKEFPIELNEVEDGNQEKKTRKNREEKTRGKNRESRRSNQTDQTKKTSGTSFQEKAQTEEQGRADFYNPENLWTN